MLNPWDRQPLPQAGDANPNDIYMGVGPVLSQWEEIELQLAYLYSALKFKYNEWDVVTEYGCGSTTKGRFELLNTTAATYFIKVIDQRLESEASFLIKRTTNFANRRHDIAHAIVRKETWIIWRIPGTDISPKVANRKYESC
jgi:hypothetical protein